MSVPWNHIKIHKRLRSEKHNLLEEWFRLEYENRKLSLSNYLQKKYDVLREYKLDYTNTGYKITTSMSFTALRYYDIDNKFWINRRVDQPIFTTLQVRDESDSKITYIQKKN